MPRAGLRDLRPRPPRETTAEIEELGIEHLHRLARPTEILVDDKARKPIEVVFRRIARQGDGTKKVGTVGILAAPGLAESGERAVPLFEPIGEEGFRRLVGGRLQNPFGDVGRAAPVYFVVDEEADAPRIVCFAPVSLERRRHALCEAFVPRVAELPPHAVAAGDRTRPALDALGIRRAVHQADRKVGRVGNGVAAPAPDTPVDEV